MPDDADGSTTRSPNMTPERWKEIGSILDTALELPPERRAEYFASACPDAGLRAEVERMLDACERSAQFLDAPAREFAAPLLSPRGGHSSHGVLLQVRAVLAARYDIQRDLGQGGMAIVYLARDVRHGRNVAVKVLQPELAAVLGAQRFLREIEILARLTHPHILPLLDSGEADGLLYYVMPFVEGESLRRRLEREGVLPVDDAVRIAREVAGALDYAHRHNVLHRDLKPENILLADGQAVVADFGIARAITQETSSGDAGSGADTRTATGVLLGTPTYMSPEQAVGDRAIDGRSDVYALGCVLLEMLAGRAPFTGPTAESIIRQHLSVDPPDLTLMRQDVPSAVLRSVKRALAKDRADRFATMEQFARALGSEWTHGDSMSVGSGAVQRRRMGGRAIVLSVATILVVAAAWTAWTLSDRIGGGASGGLVVAHARQLTFDPELELDPALSPDGRFLAYAAGPVHGTRIFVRQVSDGRSVLLTDTMTGALRWPRWSPDGSRIVFHARDGIYVVSSLGGPVRRIVEAPPARPGMPEVHSAIWSPDGTALAYVAGSTIRTVRLSDGVRRQIAHTFRPSGLAWSPDGSRLAYSAGNAHFTFAVPFMGNIASAAIWVVDLAGGTPLQVTDSRFFATSPVWDVSGRSLLFISNLAGGRDIYSIQVDRGGAAGEPQRITTGLQAHSFSIDREGRQIALATFAKVANIYSVAIDTLQPAGLADARAITRGGHTVEGLSISPNGRWLAFDSNIGGTQDIYRIPSIGGEAERLTDASGDEFMPTWSPDGREIAYQSIESGDRDIALMQADGSEPRRLTRGPAQDFYPHWSPDGRQIAYNARGVWIITRDSSGAFGVPKLIVREGARPRWSPTGEWIAYIVRDSGFRLVAPHGRQARRLLIDGASSGEERWVEWSRDGRRLYYQTLDADRGWSIRVISMNDGRSRVLLRVDDPARPFSDNFATDDRRLFFTVTDFTADLWVLKLREQ